MSFPVDLRVTFRAFVTVVILGVLLLGFPTGPASAAIGSPTPVFGQGAGLFVASGVHVTYRFSILTAGNYYLGVAADAPGRIEANLSINGTLVAQANTSAWGVVPVALAQGRYILELNGTGRAAVAWDSVSTPLVNVPIPRAFVGFTTFPSNSLSVNVILGSASSVELAVYDSGLHAVGSWNATTDTSVPVGVANEMYIVASASGTNGTYSLSWTVPGTNPGLFFGIGAGAAIVAALIVWVVLRRRRSSRR